MVEIVTVLAMTLILVAFGLPQLMNAVYSARIRGAASDLAGLVQQARFLAEQQNVTLAVYTGTVDGGLTGAFIPCYRTGTSDLCGSSAGTTWATGEPDIPFTSGISLGAAASAPSGLTLGFTPQAAGSILYFSPRGLLSTSTGASATQGFVFYLTDTHGNWAAVAVTTAARTKVWGYTGGGPWH